MVECQNCHTRFRADHLLEEKGISSAEAEKMTLDEIAAEMEHHGIVCPDCGGKFGAPTRYLTMFQTTIGPYAGSVGYGSPEAAQNIFVEFNRLYNARERTAAVWLHNIGKALRNEISPRQGLIRLREFTIADLEFFFDPEEPLATDSTKSKMRFCPFCFAKLGSKNAKTPPTSPSARPSTEKLSAANGKPTLWHKPNVY